MAKVLLLFLDGVGLGVDDPDRNPFSVAAMPNLEALLDGRRLLRSSAPFEGERATLLSLDARLGVDGAPQSATGQATLLTGQNIPKKIGRHYGPKPDPGITEILREDNMFMQVTARGARAALLNAYPPRYFDAIESGRRLYSAIPLAVDAAGIDLMTADDLQDGRALSADFTGAGWAAQTDFPPAPVYDAAEAGYRLAELASRYDLTWFDYWASDFAGHKQAFDRAVALMEDFDGVLGGLVEAWRHEPHIVLLTSDHGNMEDMNARGHTLNPVPALLVGPAELRRRLSQTMEDLTDVADAVMAALFNPGDAT